MAEVKQGRKITSTHLPLLRWEITSTCLSLRWDHFYLFVSKGRDLSCLPLLWWEIISTYLSELWEITPVVRDHFYLSFWTVRDYSFGERSLITVSLEVTGYFYGSVSRELDHYSACLSKEVTEPSFQRSCLCGTDRSFLELCSPGTGNPQRRSTGHHWWLWVWHPATYIDVSYKQVSGSHFHACVDSWAWAGGRWQQPGNGRNFPAVQVTCKGEQGTTTHGWTHS